MNPIPPSPKHHLPLFICIVAGLFVGILAVTMAATWTGQRISTAGCLDIHTQNAHQLIDNQSGYSATVQWVTPTPLPTFPMDDASTVVSPDGRYAVSTPKEDANQVVMLRDNASWQTTILDKAARVDVSWSHDGQLAYLTAKRASDDSPTLTLTLYHPAAGTSRAMRLPLYTSGDFSGAVLAGWSSDNQFIGVKVTTDQSSEGGYTYFIRTADLHLSGNLMAGAIDPNWSPVDNHFAYLITHNADSGNPSMTIGMATPYRLEAQQLLQGQPVDVSGTPIYASYFNWSPDGRFAVINYVHQPMDGADVPDSDGYNYFSILGIDGSQQLDLQGDIEVESHWTTDQRCYATSSPSDHAGWSADGHYWVFLHQDVSDGYTSVMAYDTHTGVLHTLATDVIAPDECSPLIALHSVTDPHGIARLAVVVNQPDGVSVRLLSLRDKTSIPLVSYADEGETPVWSPDYQWVAAVTHYHASEGNFSLLTWSRADGSDRQQISADSLSAIQWKDSRYLVYLTQHTGRYDVALLDAQTGEHHSIIPDIPPASLTGIPTLWSLYPSPDGQHVAVKLDPNYWCYECGEGGGTGGSTPSIQVYMAAWDGTMATAVVSNPSYVGAITWSLDGSTLAVTSASGSQEADLQLFEVNGENKLNLSFGTMDDIGGFDGITTSPNEFSWTHCH